MGEVPIPPPHTQEIIYTPQLVIFPLFTWGLTWLHFTKKKRLGGWGYKIVIQELRLVVAVFELS